MSVRPPRAETLRIEGVSLDFAGTPVLSAVDLEVAQGEVVGLLGPNGAGKTTLLRVAAGQLAPSRGRVTLGARQLADWRRKELALQVAVVPQDLRVPFPFRAGELVLMGRAPHQSLLSFENESDVRRSLDAMSRLGALHLADRHIDELSGGERQLVLLARALAQDAGVLLLDEPTSFLDLRHRLEVLRVVRAHARAGGSALVVSHDLSLAARSCDRLVVLKEGRVVADGPPSEVVSRKLILEVYGVDAEIVAGPDGLPIVVPSLEGQSEVVPSLEGPPVSNS